MPVRAFLDTNVLVYAQSKTDAEKRELARSLPERYDGMISTQVLSELGNVFTRKHGVPAAEARVRVAALLDAFDVVVVGEEVVLDAFRVAERYGYGFFDSQIIAAALAGEAELLFSEDLHDGQVIDGRLTIRSPFAPDQAPDEHHPRRRR